MVLNKKLSSDNTLHCSIVIVVIVFPFQALVNKVYVLKVNLNILILNRTDISDYITLLLQKENIIVL